METTEKIQNIINQIRPYLVNDGGDIQFIKFESGIVYIRMLGACSDCDYIDYTIKDGVEQTLINEIPEVKEVKQIN